MKHNVTLKNGIVVPALGQGTWCLGEDPSRRAQEIEGIKKGIDAGMTLLDTAEMYGNGLSEELLGEAIKPFDRSKLFIVSKVLPQNAGGERMSSSLVQSLMRLKTDYLDLYLYHWRGRYPLKETVSGLEALKKEGLIRAWGVSNFDIDDMEELWKIPGGENCLVNQVLYHTASRGIEFSLLPWMREHGVTLMSYCPLAQGGSLRTGLMSNPALQEIASKHSATVSQILLAWNIRDGHTVAIPRSSKAEHTLSNAGADKITLEPHELELIDREFPAPNHKVYLDTE